MNVIAESKRADCPPESTPKDSSWQVIVAISCILGIAAVVLTWGDGGAAGQPSNHDHSYWQGVAGGSMMLLLLLYAARKRVRAWRQLGELRLWLWAHMVLGLGGPFLILVHCRFQASSLNAAAALYSMLAVAGSGIVGRVLYVQVNRGLANCDRALRRQHLRLADKNLWVHHLPELAAHLRAFEERALAARDRAGSHWVRLLLVLPLISWQSRLQVQRAARRAVDALAVRRDWDLATRGQLRRRVRREIVQYYVCVMRVALFAAWARLFALWHIAHVPMVVLMVVSGVAHVVAVHAY